MERTVKAPDSLLAAMNTPKDKNGNCILTDEFLSNLKEQVERAEEAKEEFDLSEFKRQFIAEFSPFFPPEKWEYVYDEFAGYFHIQCDFISSVSIVVFEESFHVTVCFGDEKISFYLGPCSPRDIKSNIEAAMRRIGEAVSSFSFGEVDERA